MRYYSIMIAGAPSTFPPRYDGGAQWGTVLNGVHDPNAQQVEFQIQAYTSKAPSENSVLTVYGVTWDQIKTCNQLVGKDIIIEGGMTPGLPLATFQSQRPKLLLWGKILRCWGNWIGTEMSIGMSFAPAGEAAAEQSSDSSSSSSDSSSSSSSSSPSSQSLTPNSRFNRTGPRGIDTRGFPTGPVPPINFLQQGFSILGGQLISETDIGAATSQIGNMMSSFFGGGNIAPLAAPLNLIHNMMPNIPLSSAMQETLSKAFPNANINMLISSALKLPYQDAGIYQAIEQYMGYINKISQSILGTKSYQGITLSTIDNTLDVHDGTQPVSVGDISYLELIGQPTWLTVNTISIKVVLRGGLRSGSMVTLPQTRVNFTPFDSALAGSASGVDQRTQVTLPGSYEITKILYIGDFRNPDGASWSTNYEAATKNSVIGAVPVTEAVDKSEPLQTGTGTGTITIRPIPGEIPNQQRLMSRSARKYG